VDGYTRVLGPKHPDTLDSMRFLVRIYRYLGSERLHECEALETLIRELEAEILEP
jgi:hypothetical protein